MANSKRRWQFMSACALTLISGVSFASMPLSNIYFQIDNQSNGQAIVSYSTAVNVQSDFINASYNTFNLASSTSSKIFNLLAANSAPPNPWNPANSFLTLVVNFANMQGMCTFILYPVNKSLSRVDNDGQSGGCRLLIEGGHYHLIVKNTAVKR